MTEIRPGTETDLPAVLRLWVEAEAEPGHTDDIESLRKLLVRDPQALLLADDAGRIVGSAIAAWDGWRGSIYRLAVAPTHRRGGLGQRLLRAAEARLAAAGAARCQAIVVSTDPRATGFWRKSGWEEQTERLRFVSG